MTTGLALVPCTIKDAAAFIRAHHRHHRAPTGGGSDRCRVWRLDAIDQHEARILREVWL